MAKPGCEAPVNVGRNYNGPKVAKFLVGGGAPLLPKLRGWFAEFLNVVSPEHLGLFDLSTCVGLRYGPGRNPTLRRFSRRHGAGPFPPGGPGGPRRGSGRWGRRLTRPRPARLDRLFQ